MYDCNGFSANPTWALPNYLVYPFPWMLIMLCNYLQNAVAIIYIYVLQQPTFCFCNFLHLYFTINNNVLRKYAERNGLPIKSSHKIRKTYASMLNANEVPLDCIREMLGHSDLTTTLSYIYNPLTEKETYDLITDAL